MFEDYFKYTSTVPMSNIPNTKTPNPSTLNFYKRKGVSGKGITFTKKIFANLKRCKDFAITSEDAVVLAKAKTYFENYVIPPNDIKNAKTLEMWGNKVKTFTKFEKMTEFNTKADKEFCGAFYIKKVDRINFDYEVYTMKSRW